MRLPLLKACGDPTSAVCVCVRADVQSRGRDRGRGRGHGGAPIPYVSSEQHVRMHVSVAVEPGVSSRLSPPVVPVP